MHTTLAQLVLGHAVFRIVYERITQCKEDMVSKSEGWPKWYGAMVELVMERAEPKRALRGMALVGRGYMSLRPKRLAAHKTRCL